MDPGWDLNRPRLAWWALGAALGVALLWALYQFIGTIVFGIFLYYATRPVYRRLKYRIRPPSLAAAVALFLLVLPALLLVAYAVAIGLQELNRFASTVDLGPYESIIEPYADVSSLVSQPDQLLAAGGVAALGDFLSSAGKFVGFFGIMGLHLFVMIAIAFYLLRDDRKLVRWFTVRFSDDEGILEEYLRRIDRDFDNIFFGNILNAILTGTIGAISYSVLDLFAPAGMTIPYAALVGLLAGIASLVPVVGMKLVYVPVALYLFAGPLLAGRPETLWFPTAFVAVSFVVVDTIPDLVLRPYVSGRSLHVGALMLAYILGPLLFGWYGIFLAPMLLVLVVNFARVILPELIAGRPIQPYAVDPTYLAGDADVADATPGDVSTSDATAEDAQAPSGASSGSDPAPDGGDAAGTDGGDGEGTDGGGGTTPSDPGPEE